MIEKFHYVSYAQEVIFAAGSLHQLGEAIGRFGWQRLLLCTNRSMQKAGNVDAVKSVLGDRQVAVFDHVQPHVQDLQVEEVIAVAVEHNVDALIGLGGGSPIGMAKAVSYVSGAELPAHFPFMGIIAIPTTYAGSEMTAVYGITHSLENPPRKVTVSDPKIAPRLVIYDPLLTLDLPPAMTASTGINALAHCIEALYSVRRNPASSAAATEGIRHINNSLLRCYTDGTDLDARTEMLQGAHLAALSLASVSMGLHHGLCHVLGGSAGVPHGIANSIILPHAIRFNADVTASQLTPAAQAMGISSDGMSPVAAVEALAEAVSGLVRSMNLPQRLQDAGVNLRESELPRLARLAIGNRTVQNNPKRITEAEIEKIFRNAW